MILLDTEGLNSTERSTNTDIKIFSLAVILSSVFIYNSIGVINENTIEDLSLVGKLSENITISNREGVVDYSEFFPQFNWVLRDFYHDLEGMTPDEYLEKSLQEQDSISDDAWRKNMIRQSIVKYFKDRHCYTFIRPVTEESKLAHIEDIDYSELKQEFRESVNSFLNNIRSSCALKPKHFNGKPLNSTMFLGFVMEFV